MSSEDEIEHGTDEGYYRHRLDPDPDAGWPWAACGRCLSAHATALLGGPLPEEPRPCPTCGAPLTAEKCRSCAQIRPVEWKRDGPIWRAE